MGDSANVDRDGREGIARNHRVKTDVRGMANAFSRVLILRENVFAMRDLPGMIVLKRLLRMSAERIMVVPGMVY